MKDIEAIAARRKSRSAEYDDDIPGQFEVTYSPRQSGTYNIYLFGAIYDPAQFIGAIEVMNRATEDDLVVVHLQTPGGSIDATDTFISAMQECEGDVMVKASGGVHSAGTMILMNAPAFQLSRDFNALIHNGSAGSGGKFSDYKAETKARSEQMEKILRGTYEGFLNQKELDAMVEGKDVWLDAAGFLSRFMQRQEFLKERHETAIAVASAATSIPAPKTTKPKRKTQA